MASIKYKTEDGYVSIPMSIEAKTNEENGNGIGICSTSSGTALVVSLTGYELVTNGFVAVTFTNDVPANATLNVNNKGAKPIYYKGSAIEADVIKADDTVTFGYDGTNYVVTSLGGESGGTAAGLEIVAATGTTLNAEVGKYYRYDSDVTTLAVTLPTITGATEVQEFKMYFKTASSNVSVTFTGGTIQKLGDFQIIANSKYEVDVTWNGEKWMLQTNETLPYDSKIEYLESSGTQYIDMLYNASTNFCHVEGKLNFTSFTRSGVGTTTSYIIPFGAYYDRCPINLFIPVTDNTSTQIGVEVGQTYSTSISGGTISLNTPFSFDLKAESNKLYGNCNGIIFNGTSYSGELSTGSMKLFASYHTTYGIYAYAKMKCYYFKCYSSTGVLVRDFIPVKVGTTGYMYDKVSGQLFGNLGTGSFSLGPEI